MENILKNLPVEGIYDIRSVSGGDVNSAYKVYTNDGYYFLLVKETNDPNFFINEIAGLNLFIANDIKAPRVIANGYIDSKAYLLLSFLEEGRVSNFEDLANLIVKLHKVQSKNNKFGFDYPYKGSSISFDNTYKDTWIEIFLDTRLDELDQNLVDKDFFTKIDTDNYKKVRKIIEKELLNHTSQPSLLHGDLWSGNFMFLSDGTSAIFDPSPLYGDREFDIGISTVFGGFDQEFYKQYRKNFPLEDNFSLRLEFYRLYFLMIHLNKFGQMYKPSVYESMQKIIKHG